MKKYAILLVLSIFGFSSCMEITSTDHVLYIANKTGRDITVFYVLSKDKKTVEMKLANEERFNVLINFPGDQSPYSEEELDLAFDKISFSDGIDTVLVDLEKTIWIQNPPGSGQKFKAHIYTLVLMK